MFTWLKLAEVVWLKTAQSAEVGLVFVFTWLKLAGFKSKPTRLAEVDWVCVHLAAEVG